MDAQQVVETIAYVAVALVALVVMARTRRKSPKGLRNAPGDYLIIAVVSLFWLPVAFVLAILGLGQLKNGLLDWADEKQ